jgi:hypothetical protein
MSTSPLGRVVLASAILSVSAFGSHATASAQGADAWSFVITPQVWLSHIAKNGFAAAPDSTAQGGFLVTTTDGTIVTDAFRSESSSKNDINPQGGIQVAAQHGRLSLAGAFQYVNFDSRNDITYVHPQGIPLTVDGTNFVDSGQRWAVEKLDTTRIDVDLSGSYFFPDVVKDWLDLSAGAGFKFIYASASREFSNLSAPANFLTNSPVVSPPGLYTICFNNPCTDVTFKRKVHEDSYLYGATFPMSATLHLTRDAKWLLPFSISPLIGAEIRNDRNVVYREDLPSNVNQIVGPESFRVVRLDGTTFAYGVTADATVRWIINDTISAYAGMRVQYIHGHDKYLAYGPLLGMSFRFGGK